MRERHLHNYYQKILDTKEVRHFLRIIGDYEDLIIQNLSKSVIKYAESFLGFELSHKEIALEGVFYKNIILKTPLISVNLVKSDNIPIEFTVERNILKPNIKVGENIEIIYEAGFMEDEVPDDLKSALMQHLLSLYDIRLSGGKVPIFSLEVYGRYRTINL
jgi:hypothetical protein